MDWILNEKQIFIWTRFRTSIWHWTICFWHFQSNHSNGNMEFITLVLYSRGKGKEGALLWFKDTDFIFSDLKTFLISFFRLFTNGIAPEEKQTFFFFLSSAIFKNIIHNNSSTETWNTNICWEIHLWNPIGFKMKVKSMDFHADFTFICLVDVQTHSTTLWRWEFNAMEDFLTQFQLMLMAFIRIYFGHRI